MITSVFIKIMIIDIWQDTNYKDKHDILASILITILSSALLIPISIIADILLSPLEIGATIIYLIGTRKDKKEVERCTDYTRRK